MKQIGIAILIAGATFAASAQEFGRVLSATPLLQQVSVPRQVCTIEKVLVPGQKSGAGAAVGAIAGAAVGSALGGGGKGNGGSGGGSGGRGNGGQCLYRLEGVQAASYGHYGPNEANW
jgi:uncharacterized protein YcfJ